jgi:site-specific DNA-methyltransferase (adenine-specific)
MSFEDGFADYLGFLSPRLSHAHRLLADHGTLYFHVDYREAHYCKLLLDELFGRDCFLNEIIWAYDYGGKPRRRWPAKHDTILVYVKDRARYHFDSAEVEREPYMAPGLVGPEKAARGKLPTDVHWHTIVPTSGREKTGYPTQKPEGVVRRFVAASSRRGGWCLDFFAGSGTLGAVCAALGRRFVLVDHNPQAIAVARARLERADGHARNNGPPPSKKGAIAP